MDLLALDGHQNTRRHGFQNLFKVPDCGALQLVARDIQVLAEVPLAVQKGHPDHGEAEIGSSTQGVSGKDTEPAAISGH
jgi:hypothetical protein